MNNKSETKLRKGIIIVLLTNIINMVFSLVTSFALPKFLSTESFAQIKLYQLYVNYIGLLHFGYIDGLYLKYGGRQEHEIISNELRIEKKTFVVFQVVISCFIIICSILGKNYLMFALGLTILPFNMTTFYKLFYQAIGNFQRYGRIMNWTALMIFSTNILLLLVIKTNVPIYYVLSYVVIYWVIWGLLEKSGNINRSIVLEVSSNMKLCSYAKCLFGNIKNGFLLMIGNFASVFMTSMDRWFINFLMNSAAFAHYSFAVSMESFINMLTSPFSITLYNYFCVEKNIDKLNDIKRRIMLFACIIIECAYPVKQIIFSWLDDYIESINVLFILFASQVIYILIKCIYINLFKVYRKQKIYFVGMVATILVGAILNCAFYILMKNYMAFAYATLFSALLWLVFCNINLVEIRIQMKEWIFLIFEIIVFIITGIKFSAFYGFIVYTITTILISFIFFEQDCKWILKNVIKKFLKA